MGTRSRLLFGIDTENFCDEYLMIDGCREGLGKALAHRSRGQKYGPMRKVAGSLLFQA